MDISVAQPWESSAKKFCLHRGSLGAWFEEKEWGEECLWRCLNRKSRE
jgi:hypothetical protein